MSVHWVRQSLSTHTAGLYGAGAGLGVVGVAGGACLSSGAEIQGLTPGVLGEMGVVGSTCKHTHTHTHCVSRFEQKGLLNALNVNMFSRWCLPWLV